VTVRVVAGVDAGGTGTRALLCDQEGKTLGEGVGPAGLVDPGDPRGAVAAIRTAVREAARSAGLPLPVGILWAGVAGAGREEVRGAVEQGLVAARLATRVRVGTDAEAAFEDAFHGGTSAGVLLVVGTGSIAMARGPNGALARCGGWGGLLGDEGSGYRIGVEALRAVCRAEDGRERPTELGRALLEATGCAAAVELPAWAARATKGEVAALTPEVLRCADEGGDAVARRLLDEAVVALVRQVEVVAYRVGYLPPFRVALSGGLVSPGGAFRLRLEEGLDRHGFGVREGEVVPARGAARLGLALS